jgi:hypothetical protein
MVAPFGLFRSSRVELADVSIVTYSTYKSKSISYLFLFSGKNEYTPTSARKKKVAPAEAGATSYYLVAP